MTPDGIRAVSKDRPITPESVDRYLVKAFGDALDDARGAMAKLARSLPPDELAAQAYKLYEGFRPAVPSGAAGWGAKGELDLRRIASPTD